jgi:hypothetical protein
MSYSTTSEYHNAYQRNRNVKIRAERKALTGSSYDKEHYIKYKNLYRKSQRKYYIKKKTIKDYFYNVYSIMFMNVTNEIENQLKINNDYNTNINERREYSKSYWKEKYYNDVNYKNKQNLRNINYRKGNNKNELNEEELISFRNDIEIYSRLELSVKYNCSLYSIAYIKRKYINED